jgi:hypothetical protein
MVISKRASRIVNLFIRHQSVLYLVFNVLIFCSFDLPDRYYQTECVTNETDGYISLKIWNTEKGENYKPEQARIDAIHAILYSGIAGGGSCSTHPPILNNTEEQIKFQSIEKSFFAKKGKWSMFTRSAALETTLPTNLGVNNWKVYQISVSKNELRKYLEEQKIIKSLTNGF